MGSSEKGNVVEGPTAIGIVAGCEAVCEGDLGEGVEAVEGERKAFVLVAVVVLFVRPEGVVLWTIATRAIEDDLSVRSGRSSGEPAKYLVQQPLGAPGKEGEEEATKHPVCRE